MEIVRIDSYRDERFSQIALHQHGCFLADGEPFEVEIISQQEAIIRGMEVEAFPQILEEFRFYTPHITVFYDENRNLIRKYPPVEIFPMRLRDIQPSQFYVDEDKVGAISTFIHGPNDIVIQAMRYGTQYVSLDGHTRLYYAAQRGWGSVNAVLVTPDDSIYGFVEEAIRRKIRTPYDLKLLSHSAYEIQWNQFCDAYFAQRQH